MQSWHYGKGLIYYRLSNNQPFAVVPALQSFFFCVTKIGFIK